MDEYLEEKVKWGGNREETVRWTYSIGSDGIEWKFPDGRQILLTPGEFLVMAREAFSWGVYSQDYIKQIRHQYFSLLFGSLKSALSDVFQKFQELEDDFATSTEINEEQYLPKEERK